MEKKKQLRNIILDCVDDMRREDVSISTSAIIRRVLSIHPTLLADYNDHLAQVGLSADVRSTVKHSIPRDGFSSRQMALDLNLPNLDIANHYAVPCVDSDPLGPKEWVRSDEMTIPQMDSAIKALGTQIRNDSKQKAVLAKLRARTAQILGEQSPLRVRDAVEALRASGSSRRSRTEYRA